MISDQEQFRAYIEAVQPNADVAVVFSGPGAHIALGRNQAAPLGVEASPEGDAYGDVNNRWVMELNYADMPKVNFMRSMTPWNNDTQAFFNGLMRAFDIDQCMYFIGYEPGQQTVNQVILPEHLAHTFMDAQSSGRLEDRNRIRNNLRNFRLNELYWNRYRLELTSRQRINDRVIKMVNKYAFLNRDMDQIIAHNNMINLEDIVATAMPLSLVMRVVNSDRDLIPIPMAHNRREPIAPPVWDVPVAPFGGVIGGTQAPIRPTFTTNVFV